MEYITRKLFSDARAERKGRWKAEIDEIVAWPTGYGPDDLAAELEAGTDLETFFAKGARLNPARCAITGVVCGVRVNTIEEPADAGDPLLRQAHRRVGAREAEGEDSAGGVIGMRIR
jgi:hypothetical protein